MSWSPSRSRRIPVSVPRISGSVTRPPCGGCGWRGGRAPRGKASSAPSPAGAKPSRGKRSAITPFFGVGTRRARISETPRARAASTEDVQRLLLELAAEHPAAHHPVDELERAVPLSSRAGSSSMTLTMPLSPKLSIRRNCSVSACGSAASAATSASVRRIVVVLNWLVLLTSWVTRARSSSRHRAGLDGHGERARGRRPCRRRRRSRGSRARGWPRTARRGPGLRR